MSEFIRVWDLSSTDLVSLNSMRIHKKVIHKSNIVLCDDGKTIKAEMLTGSPLATPILINSQPNTPLPPTWQYGTPQCAD